MKSQMFKLVAKVILLVVVMAGLTACGGATFVKGGIDPLKGGEKVGVLVTSFQVNDKGLWGPEHISDKLDADAVAKMGDLLKDHLTKKGFTPVMVPTSDKVAALVKKYNELPRNGRKVISDPDTADLGDLREMFRENGVDYLIVFEGESIIKRSALQSVTGATVAAGMSLALSSVVSSGSSKGITVTYTGVLGPDGKFSFYNREQFVKNGDILSSVQRHGIAEAAVTGWLNSLR